MRQSRSHCANGSFIAFNARLWAIEEQSAQTEHSQSPHCQTHHTTVLLLVVTH